MAQSESKPSSSEGFRNWLLQMFSIHTKLKLKFRVAAAISIKHLPHYWNYFYKILPKYIKVNVVNVKNIKMFTSHTRLSLVLYVYSHTNWLSFLFWFIKRAQKMLYFSPRSDFRSEDIKSQLKKLMFLQKKQHILKCLEEFQKC